VPGEIEHFLCDRHVLDVIEVLMLVAYFVGIAQQHSHETLVERFQANDVLDILVRHLFAGVQRLIT
jgi:ABC-type transport system involved in cytochrome c biogenesis ATPase subunit